MVHQQIKHLAMIHDGNGTTRRLGILEKIQLLKQSWLCVRCLMLMARHYATNSRAKLRRFY